MTFITALFACQDFTTAEEACPTEVPGESLDNVPEEAAKVFREMSCHRGVAGISSARFDRKVQGATVAHVDYIEKNALAPLQVLDLHERQDSPGFTGVTVLDRSEAAKYDFDPDGYGLWEAVWIDTFADGVDRFNYWFQDPSMREVYLASDWLDGGYAEGQLTTGEHFAYLNMWYARPRGESADRPIVYPADGQEDVPTSASEPSDPCNLEDVGIPISVIVGEDPGTGNVEPGSNPFGIEVVAASLRTEKDDYVQLRNKVPGDGTSGLTYSAVFVPRFPLEPKTTYLFEAVLEWNDESHEVSSSFTTGTGEAVRIDEFTPELCALLGGALGAGTLTVPDTTTGTTGGTTETPTTGSSSYRVVRPGR